jgi:hypothetical protein
MQPLRHGRCSWGRSWFFDLSSHGADALGITSIYLFVANTANPDSPGTRTLKGWQQISSFFGEPVSVIQRWASEGMPVQRQGRLVVANSEDLTAWLGKQSGKPVHIATDQSDMTAELKRGLSFVRKKATKPGKIA